MYRTVLSLLLVPGLILVSANDLENSVIEFPSIAGFDDTSVVGVLFNTGKNLSEYILNESLNGLRYPFKLLSDFAEVVAADHKNLGEKGVAIIKLFVMRVEKGATYHLHYMQMIFQIFYKMIINIVALIPGSDSLQPLL
ncbi:uncharacterized protein LOC111702880 [Eurytemora carolleeae]|uniref:uncharacterized protein LOC111702880 n=1 Tax=Eurytemora carolleeae TaxID=1294199 RepID=UPI000C78EDE7|nr:uncharacterized protein LOC111702880 [Eurytemora carolleeae]|eukprot:XP_023330437.1 uncharacterized protein LOC111702880 [Eurytemora affinis]